jgi:hypothetical protein
MATIGSSLPTLADIAKTWDPDGRPARVAELLSQTNEVLTDMRWLEGNLPTGHRTTVRTGLPSATWRLLNQGVASSKSTTAQIDEQCGMLEARSQVDKDLAELNGNTAAYRLLEGQAFIEAMNQEMAQTLFYGAAAAPEEFVGLAARYSAISGATNGSHVLSGGGSGSDNSSIWLTCWGPNTVHGIYPKASKAGLTHEDLGLGDAFDGSNNRYRAYMDHWQWKCGIALRDWRYVVRIANIDVSDLVADVSAADLIELMIKAIHRIPTMKLGMPVFYMNRTCFQMLDIQRRDDVIAGGGLRYEQVDGIMTPTFRSIPIRKVDQLLETEATIT